MKKRIYIFVNGILTRPGNSDNWTGKAVTWCLLRGIMAEKVEYFSGALFSRSIGQKGRARKLMKTMSHYMANDFQIVLAGHSNGADVILDALRDLDYPAIEELHLFSPACEADFDKNGLNNANIGQVHIYSASDDSALKVAGTFFGKFFGYGNKILGKEGPINDRIGSVIIRQGGDHSIWFADGNFTGTMRRITWGFHDSAPETKLVRQDD